MNSKRLRNLQPSAREVERIEARAEEVVLGYLIDEGYADCLGSAEIILENMSDEWFDTILEAKWGRQPLPIQTMKKREKHFSDPNKTFSHWNDLLKASRIADIRKKISRRGGKQGVDPRYDA